MAPRKDTQRRHAWLYGLACFLCIGAVSNPARAQVTWKRVGTVSTLNANQLCKTDGQVLICDSTTPTISSSSLVGIGTATPQSLLSLYGGGLAVGSYAATTAIGTGSIVASGNIGIGTSLPLVTLDLSKRTDALALPVGTTGQEPSNSINGMIRYNTTLTDVEAYIGGYWTTLTTGSGGTSTNYLGTSRLVPNMAASASDTQTGLYTAGAGKVDFTSIGTQIVEISSSGMNVVTGNVGIGTTAPDSVPETVYGTSSVGTVHVIAPTTNGEAGIGFRATNVSAGAAGNWEVGANMASSGTFSVYDGGGVGYVLNINSSGNIGIGTTAPSNKLDVSGGVAIGTQYVGVTTAPTSGLLVQGNVGIGTTSPTAPLHIYADSSTTPGLLIGAGGFTTTDYISVNTGRAMFGYDSNGSSGMLALSAGTNKGIEFWINGTNGTFLSGTQAMTIGSSGNVGIGTTVPNNMLQVQGNIGVPYTGSNKIGITSIDGSVMIDYLYALSGVDYLVATDNNGMQLKTTSSTGDIAVDPNSNEVMRIKVNGRVGIGTTVPSNLLDVSGGEAIGASYVGSSTAPTNGLIVQGNIGVGTTTVPTGPKVSINGSVQVAGTGSEPCSAATVGQMRYNPSGQYMEICTYP